MKAAGSLNGLLKKTRIVSTLGNAFAPLAGKYSPQAMAAVQAAQSMGYGRRGRAARMKGKGSTCCSRASKRRISSPKTPA
jgi:hypothetical protein